MTYTPTDEQIAALCHAEAVVYVGDPDYTATKRLVAHPAFQAIIRAAQAEAVRELASELEASLVVDEDDGRIKDRLIARILNPTMRLIVEQTRAEADRIEAA